MIEFLPIGKTMEENGAFAGNRYCLEILVASVRYYNMIGHNVPWISYFAELDGELVGSAGFKGAPFKGKVEISYGTFDSYRGQGVGTAICRKLVELSLQTDPSVLITARTLAERNHSARILEKNGFQFAGIVHDIDDGQVWEWRFPKDTL